MSGCGAITADGFTTGAMPWDAESPDGLSQGSPADASSCHPGSVQTFVPNGYRTAETSPGACSATQIDQYFTACFAKSATSASCDSFAQGDANSSCAACIRTPDSALQYGPLVGTLSLVRSNVAGCIELTEPTLLSCAKAMQAVSGCELAACEANCPVADNDPNSQGAYDACAALADTQGCSAYVAAAQCVSDDDAEAGVESACLSASFADFYNYAVPIFCGPNATSDAQAPADGAAAPNDGSPTDGASLAHAASSDGAPPGSATSGDAAAAGDAIAGDAAEADGARHGDASSNDASFGEASDRGQDATVADRLDAQPE